MRWGAKTWAMVSLALSVAAFLFLAGVAVVGFIIIWAVGSALREMAAEAWSKEWQNRLIVIASVPCSLFCLFFVGKSALYAYWFLH